MKKLLLTTAAVAAFASSAVAEDQFYVRADLVASQYGKVTMENTKYKSKNAFGADFGVGYGLMDNVRAELVYNHAFAPKLKSDKAGVKGTYKPTAHAFMVKALVDVADIGPANVYGGFGLGFSSVKAKYSLDGATEAKSKAKNNMAWSAHFGAAFDVAEGVKFDLAYSYRDYGKSKDTKRGTVVVKDTAKSVRSHNLSAGVRFDI